MPTIVIAFDYGFVAAMLFGHKNLWLTNCVCFYCFVLSFQSNYCSSCFYFVSFLPWVLFVYLCLPSPLKNIKYISYSNSRLYIYANSFSLYVGVFKSFIYNLLDFFILYLQFSLLVFFFLFFSMILLAW